MYDRLTWQNDMTTWHDTITISMSNCHININKNIKQKRKNLLQLWKINGGGGLNDFGFVYKVERIYRGATQSPNIYNVLLCGH